MRRVEGYSLWLGHVGDVLDHRGILATGKPPWLLLAAIETVACLLRTGTPTLVYCSAGMSRSPCIAAAAVAMVRGCPADLGLTLVLRSGPSDVSPGLWSEVRAILP